MNAPTSGKVATPALADFIVLNEEIAALVRARIPLEANLARVGTQLPGKAGQLATRIGQRLDAGESFASAVDAECASMPATYRAVLIAGAESDNLGAALEAIVDSATRLDQLRRVTAVAMLYPLALVILSCLLTALIIKAVVPSFSWIEDSPLHVFNALAQSNLVVLLLAVVAPLAVVVIAAIWWWSSGRLSGAGWPRLGVLSTLTGAGRVHYWSDAAKFAEMLRLLVDRGLPLEKALQLAGDSTQNRPLRVTAARLAHEIQSGNVQSPSITSERDRGVPALIRLALRQASNRPLLTASLKQASQMYRERAIRAAEWYTEYLPVLLTIVVGGTFTIAFTLLVLWPYASMLHELSSWNWK